MEIFDNSTRYWGSFFFFGLLCVILQFYNNDASTKSSGLNSPTTSKQSLKPFKSFQYNYLIAFLLAMFADWLQGPYVYELYVSYGFDQAAIAELFVCGFGSSMIVGTFIGGLADKYGRKLMCMMYSVSYVIACITKLFPNYWALMLGRFLSGISTSLLFSVFESWMVCEHRKQGHDDALLGETFSYATFGNGLAAVLAGLIANYFASTFGFVAPFVVAIIPLVSVALLVSTTWEENYGNQQLNMLSSLTRGFDLVRRDGRIAALGMAQSCFEGAMYTFVFMWTPAMKTAVETEAEIKNESIKGSTSEYLGLIFAVFMVTVMVGSSIFKIFAINKTVLYKIPIVVHGIAMVTMFFTAVFIDQKDIVYAMFLLFEVGVGLFYPAYGVIKSEKIPEDIRSAVMNIFRIPLNAFVVVLLLKIKLLSPSIVFYITALAHTVSFVCYLYFYSSVRSGIDSDENKYKVIEDEKNVAEV